jgi:hypothetical protein
MARQGLTWSWLPKQSVAWWGHAGIPVMTLRDHDARPSSSRDAPAARFRDHGNNLASQKYASRSRYWISLISLWYLECITILTFAVSPICFAYDAIIASSSNNLMYLLECRLGYYFLSGGRGFLARVLRWRERECVYVDYVWRKTSSIL